MTVVRPATVATRVLLLALAALVAGCGATLVSETLDRDAASAFGACKYQAGAYALPKDLLYLEIDKVEDGSPHYFEVKHVATRRTADPTRIYCLDFLGSALSNDRMSIGRGSDDGTDENGSSSLLLTAIGSRFDDQTIKIANAIVDGIARIAVGPRGAFESKEEGQAVVAQFEFDPFDREQLTKINKALRPLHHCVFLDPTNDPYVPDWQIDQCSSYAPPGSSGAADYYGMSIINKNPPSTSEGLRGVLYRPVLTHKLVIMKKNNDPVGAPWKIFETKRVQMTNASPAFMLEVNRSLFIERTSTITFDKGVLTGVSLTKPSEAEALSGFVLRTVQTIISIPVRALVVRASDAKNRRELINAQAQMIATLRQYNAAVEREKQKREAEANPQQPVRSRQATPTGPGASTEADDPMGECLRIAVLREDKE
jgi:hypothetical protein